MSKTLTIYSASELKQVNPDAYQKAYEKFVQDCYESPHWADETVESLKAVIKHSGITLLDYEIQFSEYGWSSLVLEWPYEWGAEANASILSGQRAIAWLENNLFHKLRIPFKQYDHSEIKRWNLSKYGSHYRAGKIIPCPFTGYYADDVFINHLIKAVMEGDTLSEAYESLAPLCTDLIVQDIEQQSSEEEFEMQDWQFTESGQLLY